MLTLYSVDCFVGASPLLGATGAVVVMALWLTYMTSRNVDEPNEQKQTQKVSEALDSVYTIHEPKYSHSSHVSVGGCATFLANCARCLWSALWIFIGIPGHPRRSPNKGRHQQNTEIRVLRHSGGAQEA